MTEAVTHQMMMLRPLQAGLSGYARLQGETRRQLVQVHLRGMLQKEMRVFWYAGEGLVREVGRASANPRGEASLNADLPMDATAPRRLMALLITDGEARPRPLAIGLCTSQSAGSLLDAKNALLALCERLTKEQETPPAPPFASAEGKTPENAARKNPIASDEPKKASHKAKESSEKNQIIARRTEPHPRQRSASPLRDLPREVFLPAIETRTRPERRRSRRDEKQQHLPGEAGIPSKMPASEESQCKSTAAAPAQHTPQSAPPRSQNHCQSPTDQLPALQWPGPFQSLAAYFDRYPPVGLMNWPGWRFVHVPEGAYGLWIGYCQQDGCVAQVAYALPADAPAPQGQSFRPARTANGLPIQLLMLRA